VPRSGAIASGAEAEIGWVHSWDLSIGVDGPGTRLVVFLTGCPLRCLYCQNPDTSGFLGRRAEDALLDATDLVLLDIKAGTDAGHRS
jgi:pyruvate-formate lyase-activating enzyme